MLPLPLFGIFIMDSAQIIVILLCIILGILVVSALGLVVSFLILTHKIRKTAADTRSLVEHVARLVSVARTIASAAAGVKSIAKSIKQRKGASGGRRYKNDKTGK